MTGTEPIYFAPGIVLAGAIVLGLLGGYAFQRIWRRILPRSFSRAVLQRLPTDVRAMLTAEEPSEMLKHYKVVLLGMLGWSGRNAAGLALGLLPVAAAFLLLAAWDPSGRLASDIEVYPVGGAHQRAGLHSPWKVRDGRVLAARDVVAAAGFTVAEEQSVGPRRVGEKHAFCASAVGCMLFETMLFDTHEAAGLARSIVVRPAFFDANPFWPYMNDLELAFFAAVMLGSAGAAWAHRDKRVVSA